jgi:AcrR family transcriptional regulator
MAKPLSDQKRLAILDSAIRLFAEGGIWTTPTSAISAAAGVAGGTLFTYFASKDLLVSAVHQSLRREIADVLLSAYPQAADARVRFRHLWDRYVHWGVSHPEKFRVLEQLQAFDPSGARSPLSGLREFAEIERLAKDSIRKKRIRNHALPYIAAAMTSLAGTTISFVARNKNGRIDYSSAGFEIFWSGISA